MFRGEQKILVELIKAIAASQGLKGFWKGNFVNILYTAPFKAANFYAYDTYRNQLLRMSGNEEITNFERFLAGAIAGITATVLCIPMDTIQFMLFLLFVSQLLTELVGGRQIYQNVKGQRRLLFDVIVILFGYVIIFLRSTRVFSFLHFQRSIVDQDEDGSTWWGSIGWCDWCFPLHDPK